MFGQNFTKNEWVAGAGGWAECIGKMVGPCGRDGCEAQTGVQSAHGELLAFRAQFRRSNRKVRIRSPIGGGFRRHIFLARRLRFYPARDHGDVDVDVG